MGAIVIQQEEIDAIRKRPRDSVDEELEHLGIQIGLVQETPLARGRGRGAVDVEPYNGVLDQPDRLDPAGGQPTVTHCQ